VNYKTIYGAAVGYWLINSAVQIIGSQTESCLMLFLAWKNNTAIYSIRYKIIVFNLFLSVFLGR